MAKRDFCLKLSRRVRACLRRLGAVEVPLLQLMRESGLGVDLFCAVMKQVNGVHVAKVGGVVVASLRS